MSKVLNLDVDMSTLDLNPKEKEMNKLEIVAKVIENVCLGYSSQVKGLNKGDRTTFYALLNSLDSSVAQNNATLELDDQTVAFLRTCFKETKLNPTKLLELVEKNIENIKNR